jgi:hypothetical protein
MIMKKTLFLSVLATVLIFTFSMCDSSNDTPTNNQIVTNVQNIISVGTWRVTLFSENGINHTSHFTGYNFTFNSNNLVSASNGTLTYNGTWTGGVDNSTPKLYITFNEQNGPFEEISEDWRIMSYNSTKIELKHISGGDGSIDLLTFVKN